MPSTGDQIRLSGSFSSLLVAGPPLVAADVCLGWADLHPCRAAGLGGPVPPRVRVAVSGGRLVPVVLAGLALVALAGVGWGAVVQLSPFGPNFPSATTASQ